MTTSTDSAHRTAEIEWIARLEKCGNPMAALRIFACQYHYFSLHQIIAFAKIISLIPPLDAASLSEVGKVIYEELGEGQADRVHSVLFREFAVAVGVGRDALPIDAKVVCPAILKYLHALNDAFQNGPLPKAIASYVFLEQSAVRTYDPLLASLQKLQIDANALRFFEIHTIVEREHAGAADRIARDYHLSTGDSLFGGQLDYLDSLWQQFWLELTDRCFEGSK